MDVDTILISISEASFLAAWVALPLVVIVTAVTWLGKRQLPVGVRYGLWSIVLARFLLPVSVESPWSVTGLLDGWLPATTAVAPIAGVEMLPPAEYTAEWQPVPNPSNTILYAQATAATLWSWTSLLMLAWWSGAGLMLAWAALTSWRCRCWLARSTLVTDSAWLESVAAGRAAFRLWCPVQVRAIAELTSPAVIGWFRPTLLLPTPMMELSPAERQHVVWHELAHVARGDAFFNGLLLIVRVFQWWNPLAWWAQRCWLATRECLCDAQALEHLPRGSAADYGRTLLKFLEQTGPSWGPAAGLLGARSAIRQRLADVQHWQGPRTWITRWVTAAIVLLCAGICLTDAATPPEVTRPPISVPANAVWRVATLAIPDDGPTTVRVYDLTKVVARVRQDDPALSEEMGAFSVHQLVEHALGRPLNQTLGVRTGMQLVMRLTQAQHQVVEAALERMRKHGERQVVMEIRLITVGGELSELGLPAGGEVLSSVPPVEQPLGSPKTSGMDVRAVRGERLPIPTYLQQLADLEVGQLIRKLPEKRNTNILSAPKITMFEGVSAMIAMGTERPFVTGFETLPDGGIKPQVTICQEGLNLQLDAVYSDDASTCQLACRVQQTEIRDVEVMTVRSGDQERSVQIPRIDDTVILVQNRMAAGKTLLVVPLQRDSQRQLTMTLITPRLLPPQVETNPPGRP